MGNTSRQHQAAINAAKRRGIKGMKPRPYCPIRVQVVRDNPGMESDAIDALVVDIKAANKLEAEKAAAAKAKLAKKEAE